MKLGDFFSNAPHSRPINPKPVSFTAIARGAILPGGIPNPHNDRPVAATVKGAFVFLGGEGTQQARFASRKHVQEKSGRAEPHEDDFHLELTYQILWRALHEYDDREKKVGDKLFPSIENARELLEVREANRLFNLYIEYVADEHPEGVDEATFRGAEEGSAPVVARISR